jgi:uncharacterized membrane protein YfbV (UPF0208 family)
MGCGKRGTTVRCGTQLFAGEIPLEGLWLIGLRTRETVKNGHENYF